MTHKYKDNTVEAEAVEVWCGPVVPASEASRYLPKVTCLPCRAALAAYLKTLRERP